MAVEQLGELSDSGRYDLIVVDTPPTQHALDFLEAPDRLPRLPRSQDRQVVRQALVQRGLVDAATMNRTVGFLFHKVEDATGVAALAEISDFFAGMQSLFEGFGERTERVYRVLRSPKTAFVLVSSPEEEVLEEAEY